MRSKPLCWRCSNADPRGNARDAAKLAQKTRPAFANVVHRGRGAGLAQGRSVRTAEKAR